ncbi:MAG: integrase [Comamonadaceae bacterium PBBC1]|nr:MAG: integrase [Comamonadaceae bacterium PBBC1]
MARSGIYKAEVLRARDALVAAGRHPSIDAVREELGHTGSKSTIHRFLKEIEEEEGPQTGSQANLSEALQDLVGRLAARLNEEAQEQISRAQTEHTEQMGRVLQELSALKTQNAHTHQELQQTNKALASEKTTHAKTHDALNARNLECTKLTQQVLDLQAQIEGQGKHIQSLEEKHQHARMALDHFRESSQAQRTQDQRKHEQQVQYLQTELRTLNEALSGKQQEVLHLSQEKTRLTTDLSRSQNDWLLCKEEIEALLPLKALLEQSRRDQKALGQRVAELELLHQQSEASGQALRERMETLNAQKQQSDLSQAMLQAALTVQEQMVSSLLAKMTALPESHPELAQEQTQEKPQDQAPEHPLSQSPASKP